MDNLPNNPQDKRTHRRVRASFTVIFQVDRPVVVKMLVGWGKEVEGLMVDLSEGGMALLTGYNIPVGTVFHIKFTLINLALQGEGRIRTLRIEGKVCYSNASGRNEYRLGICFENMTEYNKAAIAEFVRRN